MKKIDDFARRVHDSFAPYRTLYWIIGILIAATSVLFFFLNWLSQYASALGNLNWIDISITIIIILLTICLAVPICLLSVWLYLRNGTKQQMDSNSAALAARVEQLEASTARSNVLVEIAALQRFMERIGLQVKEYEMRRDNLFNNIEKENEYLYDDVVENFKNAATSIVGSIEAVKSATGADIHGSCDIFRSPKTDNNPNWNLSNEDNSITNEYYKHEFRKHKEYDGNVTRLIDEAMSSVRYELERRYAKLIHIH